MKVEIKMRKETSYGNMADSDLIHDFEKSLSGYKRWIAKRFDLNEDELEEAEYMSFTRREIHKIVEELQKRGITYDAQELARSDREWQNWILSHSDPSFKLEHPRDDQPKSHWWEWIDQLASLTDEQRNTL